MLDHFPFLIIPPGQEPIILQYEYEFSKKIMSKENLAQILSQKDGPWNHPYLKYA